MCSLGWYLNEPWIVDDGLGVWNWMNKDVYLPQNKPHDLGLDT